MRSIRDLPLNIAWELACHEALDMGNSEGRLANLDGANLDGANLDCTSIDPTNAPNADILGFHIRGDGWVEGFRTRATSAAGRRLHNDRIYGTEVFSVSDTKCHPGWYLWPTRQLAVDFSGDVPMVLVKARTKDIHRAGSKWRSRAIWVLGEI